MNCKIASKMIVLLGVLVMMTSCGYKDIDKRSFVVAIGVDKSESEDNKYKVLLKIAIPSSDPKAGQNEFIISMQESDSITDAVRTMKSKVDKELDFSHAKAIIIGEKVMEGDIQDIQKLLDWFIRRRDIQKIAWIGVGSPNAEDILKQKRKVERLPSNAIFLSFGQSGTESAYIVSEYLFDFRKRITEKGVDPILPILENKKKYFEIKQATVFGEENQRITLSQEETKIVNILLNRVTKADIKVMKKDEEEQESFYIAADVAKVKYKIKNGNTNRPIVEVKVKIEGIVEEALEEMNEKRLQESSEIAEKQMKEKVLHLLTKLQEEKLDPIGLGLMYRASHFNDDDWETWKKLYPEVEFKVDVKLTLNGTGLLN